MRDLLPGGVGRKVKNNRLDSEKASKTLSAGPQVEAPRVGFGCSKGRRGSAGCAFHLLPPFSPDTWSRAQSILWTGKGI